MEKTSTQKWENSLLIYKKHCKQIIAISKSIRYVGIINEYGKTLTGTLKSGIKPLFSRNQVRDEFYAISTFMKLRNKTNHSIGSLNYIFLNHQKVSSIIFYPIGLSKELEGTKLLSVERTTTTKRNSEIFNNINKHRRI